jgi:C4-type Zn-finger protein
MGEEFSPDQMAEIIRRIEGGGGLDGPCPRCGEKLSCAMQPPSMAGIAIVVAFCPGCRYRGHGPARVSGQAR